MSSYAYDDPFEKAQLALSNALQPTEAARALVSPGDLSPQDHRTIGERILGPNPGVLGVLLDTVTNPLVLAGIVLSARFPIASASKLMDWGNRLKGYMSRELPILNKIHDFRHTFRGPVAEWFEYAAAKNNAHMTHVSKLMAGHLDEFEALGGAETWSMAKNRTIAMALDGLHKKEHKAWSLLRRYAPEKSGAIEEARQRIEAAVTGLSGAEKKLLAGFRSTFDEQWTVLEPLMTDPNKSRSVSAHLKNLGIGDIHMGKKVDDFLPHVEALSREEMERRFLESRGGMVSPAIRLQAQGGKVAKQASRSVLQRTEYMLPALDDLEKLGVSTPELERAYDAANLGVVHKLRRAGYEVDPTMGTPIRQYTLNALRASRDYTVGVARTVGWSSPPPGASMSVGELIKAELPVIRSLNPTKAALLEDTYIPLATGQTTLAQLAPSLRWADTRTRAATWLKKQEWMPKDVSKALLRPLESEMPLTWHGAGGAISSYLYGTTLSFNVLSPVKNLFQHLITTVPTVGVGYTVQGMKETLKRTRTFTRNLKVLGEDGAWRKAFPEFYEAGLDIGSITGHEKFGDYMFKEAQSFALAGKAKKAFRGFTDAGMFPFTQSERFNRLSAFYAARAKALKELPGTAYKSPFLTTMEAERVKSVVLPSKGPLLDEAANRFASSITYMTQYGGGPLSTPALTTTWWSPLRQYTQFPLRTLGFLTGPAMKMGGSGGINPGTLGRALTVSGGAYYGAKGLLDADVSDTLLWGAIPNLQEGDQNPFGVMPLVPPLLQVAGGALKAVTEGDIEPFQRQLPTVIPAGIGISRMSTLWEPAAKLFHRPYADYAHPNTDGKVPVYSAKGALTGYYDSIQLYGKVMGIGDIQGQKEVALNRYLLRQRDRIKAYRRAFTDAAANGETRKMEEIQGDWHKHYPDMGDLSVKRTDIQAVQFRRLIPRLERLLDTLPREAREQMAAVIATSMGAQAGQFMGIDPQLLSSGTAGSRMQHRIGQRDMPFMGQGRLPSPYGSGSGSVAREAALGIRDDLATSEVMPGSTPRGYLGG